MFSGCGQWACPIVLLYRYGEGIDKLKSALEMVEEEDAFKRRIEAQLCKGHAKVRG